MSSWEELRREDDRLEERASSASLEVVIDCCSSMMGGIELIYNIIRIWRSRVCLAVGSALEWWPWVPTNKQSTTHNMFFCAIGAWLCDRWLVICICVTVVIDASTSGGLIDWGWILVGENNTTEFSKFSQCSFQQLRASFESWTAGWNQWRRHS